jgi:thiol-disulfide isomerase/thioredoxin
MRAGSNISRARTVRAHMGRCTQRFSPQSLLPATLVIFYLSVLLVGTCAAQATALDLAGAPVDPLKAAHGKVVVLLFVRTDCPVSNRYSPTIQRLGAQHAGKAVFWLVYPDRAESAEMIRQHERDFGYQLPALRDPQHTLVRQGHVQITPEAAVFDANRRLVYHGRIDNLYEDFGRARTVATTHELDDAIRAAISGKGLPTDSVPAVGCYISDLE